MPNCLPLIFVYFSGVCSCRKLIKTTINEPKLHCLGAFIEFNKLCRMTKTPASSQKRGGDLKTRTPLGVLGKKFHFATIRALNERSKWRNAPDSAENIPEKKSQILKIAISFASFLFHANQCDQIVERRVQNHKDCLFNNRNLYHQKYEISPMNCLIEAKLSNNIAQVIKLARKVKFRPIRSH